MATESVSAHVHSEQLGRASARSWFQARALWAGLSIMTMWLAVLFVGVFGENIVSSTPGGTTSSVPVVVALLPFVLPATIVVARRGLTSGPDERGKALDQKTQPREETAGPSPLRTKLA
jgi:hypothetical protein